MMENKISEEEQRRLFINHWHDKDVQLVCEVPVFCRSVDLVKYNQKARAVTAVEFKTHNWKRALEQVISTSVSFDYLEICVQKPKTTKAQEKIIRAEAAKVFAEEGIEVSFKVGTMIEIPRAALTADKIASRAEYFSFGTNDLTQMTFGYSRDDIASFLPVYLEQKILAVDPFQVLDQNGVGQLIDMAVKRGRSVRPNLKCGICGEHGGEPSSVKFCHRVGLDYVSCSPFRVPIARIAAAQAAVEDTL